MHKETSLHKYVVLRVVSYLMLPFILVFGFYIQIHGEETPGGGFQAGVILASSFILHALLFGVEATLRLVPFSLLRVIASLGLLLYAVTGVVSFFLSGQYLEYSVLLPHATDGQKLGIVLIEWGVGLTIYAVMLLVFFSFAARGKT